MGVELLILLLLLLIAYQDHKYRGVTWYIFPILCALLAYRSVQIYGLAAVLQHTGINLLFVALQLLILQLYFWLKHRRWQWIFDTVLGWGDVVFLITIAVYLPVIEYFIFYVSSLILVLLMTLVVRIWSKSVATVPLAGWQALLFLILLSLEHFKIVSLKEIILPSIY